MCKERTFRRRLRTTRSYIGKQASPWRRTRTTTKEAVIERPRHRRLSPDRSAANTDRLQKHVTSVNLVAHHADSNDSYSSREDATETESDDDSCSSHNFVYACVNKSYENFCLA